MIAELPCGYYDDDGRRHRDVEITALSGRDEEALAATGRASAEQVTDVLARCLRRVGTVEHVDEAVARRLTVGDRQYLMLKLREVTFGPAVALVTSCSWPDCGERVDIEFQISDVPVATSDTGPIHQMELSAGASPGAQPDARSVSFRLPTGADQEDFGPLLEDNPASALHALLEACVLGIGSDSPPSPERISELTPLARAELERAMSAAAAGPVTTMRTSCPGCGREFDVPLDVADLFFAEACGSADLLYRQVHYLAYHYHWGEGEILSLPRAKRLHYVELLAEEIEGLNDALA